MTVETLKGIPPPLEQQALIMVQMCAYAGSGSIVTAQEMLQYCDAHLVDEEGEG